LGLAGRLGCEPSLQTIGHAAAGAAVQPRRHADPDFKRMAQPVTFRDSFSDERHVLAKRDRRDAAHCLVDVAAYSEARARVVDMARPRVVHIWSDKARQPIHEADILEVMCGAPNEPSAE
jgi:hypothetical protein